MRGTLSRVPTCTPPSLLFSEAVPSLLTSYREDRYPGEAVGLGGRVELGNQPLNVGHNPEHRVDCELRGCTAGLHPWTVNGETIIYCTCKSGSLSATVSWRNAKKLLNLPPGHTAESSNFFYIKLTQVVTS